MACRRGAATRKKPKDGKQPLIPASTRCGVTARHDHRQGAVPDKILAFAIITRPAQLFAALITKS
jgi:hypothetical protein